jgi:hypothetical protein
MREKTNTYRILVRKPKGKTPLRRLRYRWVDNIKLDLVDRGLGELDWIGVVQDRYRWKALVNS